MAPVLVAINGQTLQYYYPPQRSHLFTYFFAKSFLYSVFLKVPTELYVMVLLSFMST